MHFPRYYVVSLNKPPSLLPHFELVLLFYRFLRKLYHPETNWWSGSELTTQSTGRDSLPPSSSRVLLLHRPRPSPPPSLSKEAVTQASRPAAVGTWSKLRAPRRSRLGRARLNTVRGSSTAVEEGRNHSTATITGIAERSNRPDTIGVFAGSERCDPVIMHTRALAGVTLTFPLLIQLGI